MDHTRGTHSLLSTGLAQMGRRGSRALSVLATCVRAMPHVLRTDGFMKVHFSFSGPFSGSPFLSGRTREAFINP